MKIKVCDQVPGAGKTEAAIHMMKRRPYQRYIFVTPYLDEVQRIKTSCAGMGFREPESHGKFHTKTKDLTELIQAGVNNGD